MKHPDRKPRSPYSGLICFALVLLLASAWEGQAQLVNDGATATLNNVTNSVAGDVMVGTNGSFTLLTLTNAAYLTNGGFGYIGRNNSARSNTVWLAGTNTRWRTFFDLHVGSSGSYNRLITSNGASIFSGISSHIGYETGSSNNLAVVTGPGSSLTNILDLYIGNRGLGSQLVVSNGGVAASQNAYIGNNGASRNNSALVTGAGSRWNVGSRVYLGYDGSSNQLVVSDGGVVQSLEARIGSFNPSSNNLAVVTGAGSLWNVNGFLTVGSSSSDNQLVISNGGVVLDVGGTVGDLGSGHRAVVTGPGSMWSNSFDFYMGKSSGSRNQLLVSNGGMVSSPAAYLGFATTSSDNRIITDGGTFRVANAAGSAGYRVQRGTNVLNAGTNWVDQLLMTSTEGFFEFNGGTLITRLGFISNGVPFVVGRNGNTPATWDARIPSVGTIIVSPILQIGSNVPNSRLLLTTGTLQAAGNGAFGESSVLGVNVAASNTLALVTGTGAYWSNANRLFIGNDGARSQLVISNAGVVSADRASLGRNVSSSNNLAVVTGAGSAWNMAGLLHVGDSGPVNQLVVSNGAVVSDSQAFVGRGSDGNLAVVTGAGSRWNHANEIYVGESGADNRLVVSNSARVLSSNGFIGATSNNNMVVVTSPGSAWTNALELFVGSSGSGNHLVVSNGGTVYAGSATYIGANAGANNRLTTDGGLLHVTNQFGPGALNIRRGTNVLNSGTNDVYQLVMTNGAGHFEFNGGTLVTRGESVIANGVPFIVGNGAATPAIWDARTNAVITSTLRIGGNAPNSRLLLTNGQTLQVRGSGSFVESTVLGSNVIASGALALVANPGTYWSNAQNMVVGAGSAFNQLVISNGAVVRNAGGYLGLRDSSSNNLALVTGAGSLWTNANSLLVGFLGSGNQLVISNGAMVRNWFGQIGEVATSSNNLAMITGAGSVWSNGFNLFVGTSGSGNQLVVSNGGMVVNLVGFLGVDGSNSAAVVTGPGSVWTNINELRVGQNGAAAQLWMTNGGTVVASNIYVGFNPTSTNNRIRVDGGVLRATNAPGTLVLDIRRGTNVLNTGMVEVDRLLVTDSAGQFEFNGGTLLPRATTINNGRVFTVGNGANPAALQLRGSGTHSFANGLVIAVNGRVAGNGTVIGPLTVQPGALLSPGTSIGTLSLSNSPSLQGTTLMEISKNGAVRANDQLQVASTLTYGGVLTVSNLGPTTLAAGDRFQLFNATSYAGSFSALNLPLLNGGLGWTNKLLVDGSIEVLAGDFPPPLFTVTNTNDSGPGSLREAITIALPGSLISITATGTITLASPLPFITNALTIRGSGAANLTISGNNSNRIFFVDAPGQAVLFSAVTLANGRAKGGDGGTGDQGGGGGLGAGGAIFVNAGNVTVSNLNFSGNSAVGGKGGDGSGMGGGGGGGLGGDAGNGWNKSGGGGGGFYGRGGHVLYDGGGGGGGIFGNGGNGGTNGFGGGGGGGGLENGASANNFTGGAGGTGGGGAGGSYTGPNGNANGSDGLDNGGGGGASHGVGVGGFAGGSGGNGGRFGGGGGANDAGNGGNGGEFGGGGGSQTFTGQPGNGGNGGFGGGGGSGIPHSGIGGFGAGGAGRVCSVISGGSGGAFGGRGAAGFTCGATTKAGGGGGAALGGAIFVRGTNASLTWVDSVVDAGVVTPGQPGTEGGPPPNAWLADPGQAAGSALFLMGGTNVFTISSGQQIIAGTIGGWSNTPVTLIKQGAGTLILAATNSLPGTTLVNGGTLRIDGDHRASSNVTLNAGSSLAGSGRVAALRLNNDATLSPGASPGALTASNTVWSGAGHYNWQVLDAAGAAGTGYDVLAINGTLDVSAASGFRINLWSLSGTNPDVNSLAANFTNGVARTWTLATTTGGVIGFNAANFVINTAATNGTGGFANPTAGVFRLAVSGNNLVLQYLPSPAAVTLAATGIAAPSVLLNGSLVSSGIDTTWYFEYGSSPAYGSLTAPQVQAATNVAVNVNAALTNNVLGATYHYRLVASNVAGVVYGSNLTFVAQAIVQTLPASNIGLSNATLSAMLNAGGVPAAFHFQYGTNAGYGFTSVTSSLPATLVTVTNSAAITGLNPGITYHYRVVLSNSAGVAFGSNLTFTTALPPLTAQTLPATGVGPTNATLQGAVNPAGFATTYYFQYGLTTNYGSQSIAVLLPAGFTETPVSANVSNLLPATLYQCRLVASNSTGIASGTNIAFTTPASGPVAQTLAATAITVSNATLSALVNPGGAPTTVYFQYGTNTGYGSNSAAIVLPAGNADVTTNIAIGGLTFAQQYFYRVAASNSLGVVYGTNATFTTPALRPIAQTLAPTNLTGTSATFRSLVNPGGVATDVWFEYGATTNYGSFSGTNSLAASKTDQPLNADIGALLPNATYHYRVWAANSAGITNGADVSFTTPAPTPTFQTLPATNITFSSATLRGNASPNGTTARYWFDYGATTNFGSASATNFLPPHNSVLRFNGSNQQMTTAQSLNLSNQSFTVEAWVRRAGINRDDYFFQQGSNGIPNRALTFGWRGNNRFTFAFWGNDLDTSTAQTDTNWHHWAGTFDAGTGARVLYRDGVVVATNLSGVAYQGTGTITIGRSPGVNTWFGGDLSEVRLWTVARSAAEIANGLNFSLSGSEPGLLACWRLNDGSGSKAADAGTNANHGTLVNAPAWVTPEVLPANLTGLSPGTSYLFRLAAANASGTSYGSNLVFTTLGVVAPQLNLPVALANGSFQLSFSSTPGTPFTVLATTNVAEPLTNWTILGAANETPAGSGQFQFIDAQATNFPHRFYLLRSP